MNFGKFFVVNSSAHRCQPQWGKALQFVNTVIMTINNGQQLSGREAAKYERPGASKVLTPQCTEGV